MMLDVCDLCKREVHLDTIDAIYFCDTCGKGCCSSCIDPLSNVCEECYKKKSPETKSVMVNTVPDHVYRRRLERMKQLIEVDAPSILIYMEAKLIIKARHPGWWYRFKSWFASTKLGQWTDMEWIRFKLTGKSEVYNPDDTIYR